MKNHILNLATLIFMQLSLLHSAELGNPIPQSLQTPNGLRGIQESLKRLEQGSEGKTPTVKNFPSWVGTLAEHGEPKVYTRENSHNFDYIGMPIGGIGCGQLYLGGDGKLWHWDIFNDRLHKGFPAEQGAAYAHPPLCNDPKDGRQHIVEQGFAIRLKTPAGNRDIGLNRDGFQDIRFVGQYPIGQVSYSDHSVPVKVELEAMSPFTPLNLADSTSPATILSFTVTNTGTTQVEGELAGWLENAVAIESARRHQVQYQNKVVSADKLTLLGCSATETNPSSQRPSLVFEDFSGETFGSKWKVEGTAFGTGPVTEKTRYYAAPVTGLLGERFASSYFKQDSPKAEGDAATGKLTSEPFTIDRDFISVHLSGGNHPGETCVNLVVDGKPVRSLTGDNSTPLVWKDMKVGDLRGKTGILEIVDNATGHWGHIFVDRIEFRDQSSSGRVLEAEQDFGTMALGLLNEGGGKAFGNASVDRGTLPSAVFAAGDAEKCADKRLVGAVGRSFSLKPGEKTTVRFILSWYFPNPLDMGLKTPSRRAYAVRFKSAGDVAEQLASRIEPLTSATRLWRDTWYDSTLPHWFLDRTFLNTSILAAATSVLLEDGRFYGNEGAYSCPGTCTHVWGYNHAMGCLFPELEKRLREMVDFKPGIGMNDDGGIAMRGEYSRGPAVDGQCGIIIRALRVHQMSPDNEFLKRNWASIRKATDYLINTYDRDHDGIMEGGQHNTLDASWFGKVAWLSIYYQAALRATAAMADDMGESDYAKSLRNIADRGRAYAETKLFNGEYFIHEMDPKNPESPGSFNGCEIDQLFGQSQAYQVGLGQIIDPDKVTTALNSLWKYNFTTDVGKYREKFKPGRWYAMPGEGGIIMCTWPYGGDEALKRGNAQFAAYLNECMNGFEYGCTSLMIWQGLVDKALAHTRAIHERHDGSKRNPWNEVECGSHYSRSMASYGLFTAISGFECDGPKGYICFAPRLTPENFKCAFTSAEGWGSFEQQASSVGLKARLAVKWGHLRLKELALVPLPAGTTPASATVTHDGKQLPNSLKMKDGKAVITLADELVIPAGGVLQIHLNP